eukprot:5402670-Pyramimonas_sp.AAC.1
MPSSEKAETGADPEGALPGEEGGRSSGEKLSPGSRRRAWRSAWRRQPSTHPGLRGRRPRCTGTGRKSTRARRGPPAGSPARWPA